MNRHGILNLGLNQAIAAMGHGDYLIVCDAGFPIPSEVPRIDLAVIPDLPDIETVLTAINGEFIAEKVAYAAEMAQNNPRLKEKVGRIFAGAELTSVPHAEILGPLSHKAKFIVRTKEPARVPKEGDTHLGIGGTSLGQVALLFRTNGNPIYSYRGRTDADRNFWR
jgi:D-ribose pyranase